MIRKYIFYDFETTGKGKKASPTSFGQSPNWEQILQVGAIVADEKLQSTNKSIKEAVVTSIYLMINARIQTVSMAMGNPVYLSPREIKNMTDMQFSPLAMDRMWEAFCLRAGLKPV